jgi:hypothetical protein
MSKKYHTSTVLGNHSAEPFATIITSDLFLASFLHCVGCTLARVEKNDRRRVSFVFVGERVRELREAYRTGKVSLDIKLFRESMNLIRDRMNTTLVSFAGDGTDPPEQRSMSHGSTKLTTSVNRSMQPVAQC